MIKNTVATRYHFVFRVRKITIFLLVTCSSVRNLFVLYLIKAFSYFNIWTARRQVPKLSQAFHKQLILGIVLKKTSLLPSLLENLTPFPYINFFWKFKLENNHLDITFFSSLIIKCDFHILSFEQIPLVKHS